MGFAIRTLTQHRYSERLVDHDIIASVGSKNDSFDNAMAELFNGLYEWELIP